VKLGKLFGCMAAFRLAGGTICVHETSCVLSV
jgi:hypothetical protein